MFRTKEIFFLVVFLLFGCSVNQTLDTNTFYKRDMIIDINGDKYEGVTVVKNANEYDLKVEPQGKIDYLVIRSCHREETYRPNDEVKLFGIIPLPGTKPSFKYKYTPIDIEKNRICPLRGDSYDADKGNHSWFFLDFESKDYALDFTITCNGKKIRCNGVCACQARTGLVQILEFRESVRFAPPLPSHCALPTKTSDNRFEIGISHEECLYQFDNASRDMGRVTFIGYEGLLVRGDI